MQLFEERTVMEKRNTDRSSTAGARESGSREGRFRKLPVEVDAICFTAYTEACAPAPWQPEGGRVWQWMNERRVAFGLHQSDDGPVRMSVPTLEGIMYADIGDWLICDVKGEVYPCKPDVFEQTYEPVA